MKKIGTKPVWILALIVIITGTQACSASNLIIPLTGVQQQGQETIVYLPLIFNGQPAVEADNTPRIHIPYLQVDNIFTSAFSRQAVFWFGKVTPTENYMDVRLGYNDSKLYIYTAAIDRLLWYDTTPTTNTLTDWDGVTVYLDTGNQSYRFMVQASPEWEPRAGFQTAAAWNGSSWQSTALSFTSTSGWRGDGFNNYTDDKGWNLAIEIPFSSLGVSAPPSEGTEWRLGVSMNDRDNETSLNPVISWPPEFQAQPASTWGIISFGLPTYTPSGTQEGTTTIREGLNGAVVPDGSVGGYTTCGGSMEYWTEWGNRVYNSGEALEFLNIQNQRDIADYVCFSKYYVTFPLSAVPPGKVILSATLTLHHFGNSQASPDVPIPPNRSLIQVFTIQEDWSEESLSWNSAPLAMENVSQNWVDPLDAFPGWPGIPRTWDLTYAAAQAYQQGTPLRLALYSADGAYHSGKYFVTSETGDWNAAARPTLEIIWGSPSP